MPLKITEGMASEIKELLYRGYTYANIALRFGLSTGSVYQIKAGLRYPDVPWPDRSVGPMSAHRANQLNEEEAIKRRSGRRRNINSRDEKMAAAAIAEATDPVFARAVELGEAALAGKDPERPSAIASYRQKRRGGRREDT